MVVSPVGSDRTGRRVLAARSRARTPNGRGRRGAIRAAALLALTSSLIAVPGPATAGAPRSASDPTRDISDAAAYSPAAVAGAAGDAVFGAQAEVAGTVTDAVSGAPIVGALVTIAARPTSVADSGLTRLTPIDDSVRLARDATTGPRGRYQLEVSQSAGELYVMVEVERDGYRPAAHSLLRVTAGEVSQVDFELIPIELGPEDELVVQERHAARREQLYTELRATELLDEHDRALPGDADDVQSPPDSDRAGTGRSGERAGPAGAAGPGRWGRQSVTVYVVPDEVFVTSLPGSGYTGLIDFDEFLSGVVAAEMGDSFPYEALKVQAIASRTYALERYDRVAVADGGQAYTPFFSTTGESYGAVANTTKRVILYDGSPVATFFSARCNGDFTLDSEDGLSCIPGGCASECEVGGLLGNAAPLPYARARPCSGHANCSMTTEPCCVVSIDAQVQYHFGHGVGMCQRGAQDFACRIGLDADEILDGYYTDVSIANDAGPAPGARVVTSAAVNARATPCSSDRVVVALGSSGTVVAGPQITECSGLGSCLGQSGTYWTWWQVDFDGGPSGRWLVEDFIRATEGGGPANVLISGRVTDAETDAAVAGVTVDCDTASSTTATDGTYEVGVPFGWSGACVPGADGYTFTPVERTYDTVATDQADQDYAAQVGLCSQPLSSGEVPLVSDCLFILQAALALIECESDCLCAPTGRLPVSASDAFVCMASAVGLDPPLACPCGS